MKHKTLNRKRKIIRRTRKTYSKRKGGFPNIFTAKLDYIIDYDTYIKPYICPAILKEEVDNSEQRKKSSEDMYSKKKNEYEERKKQVPGLSDEDDVKFQLDVQKAKNDFENADTNYSETLKKFTESQRCNETAIVLGVIAYIVKNNSNILSVYNNYFNYLLNYATNQNVVYKAPAENASPTKLCGLIVASILANRDKIKIIQDDKSNMYGDEIGKLIAQVNIQKDAQSYVYGKIVILMGKNTQPVGDNKNIDFPLNSDSRITVGLISRIKKNIPGGTK